MFLLEQGAYGERKVIIAKAKSMCFCNINLVSFI